jgi:predicted metalloendopeptidase
LTATLPDHINLNDNETIAFDSFSYLAAFNELIEMTPKRTIVNFIMMRIADTYLMTLTGEDQDYLNETRTWEKRCMGQVLHNLPILVNSIYIRNYFDLEMKKLVTEIIEGIRNEFMKILISSTWMDKITKKRAIFKLQSMKALVGFPDELLDDKELKKYFENLTITDNFFENILAINIFNNYQEFKDYKNDINKTDWRIHYSITEVNAFYLPFDNLISKFL